MTAVMKCSYCNKPLLEEEEGVSIKSGAEKKPVACLFVPRSVSPGTLKMPPKISRP